MRVYIVKGIERDWQEPEAVFSTLDKALAAYPAPEYVWGEESETGEGERAVGRWPLENCGEHPQSALEILAFEVDPT